MAVDILYDLNLFRRNLSRVDKVTQNLTIEDTVEVEVMTLGVQSIS
jgi:hypothetical protein